AVSASPQSAARTPATLLAAMLTPVPVQQQTIPRSASPPATTSPTDRPTSGHGDPTGTGSTTSWPSSASSSRTAGTSGASSSEPRAMRTGPSWRGEPTTRRAYGFGVDRTPRTVAVVPHTHWDREWYLPFQAFRLRLVRLLDDLLPELEA